MRHGTLRALAIVAAFAFAGTLHGQSRPETALRAAIELEEVKGDIKAAIEQYRRLSDSGNRAVAAQALLRLAAAYQAVGDAQSRAAYERVVRDFPDQSAAVARAQQGLQALNAIGETRDPSARRIAGSDEAAIPRDVRFRRVFSGASVVGMSPDGGSLIYHPSAANAVIMRDLSTGVERTLDEGELDFFENARFSPNGAQVAYGHCGTQGECDVRTVDLRQATPKPRSLYRTQGSFVGPIDWSPDGQSIAVYIQRRADLVLQLGILRVPDGALQVLQSMPWGGTLGGFFSRDGRDVAYSQPMDEDKGAHDIVLMDLASRRQTTLVTSPNHDFPLGWTRDGRHLLFASDRSGTVGVWAQAVVDREAVGAPSLIHANIGGDVAAVGVSSSGQLYVGVRTFSQDVEVALLDAGSGKVGGTVPVRSAADRTWLPAWSADGRSLAYVLVRNGTENTVGIRAVASGVERELALGAHLDRVRSLTWTPDGQALVGWGRDLRGRYGIFHIDATDGQVRPVVFRDPPPVRQFVWSPDGRTLRYGTQGTFFEFDGQTERPVDLLKGSPGLPSPDGRWIARLIGPQRAERAGTLIVASTQGDITRELYRFDAPDRIYDMRWARDGRTMIVLHGRDEANPSLIMLPIEGPARALDLDMNRVSESQRVVEISPDRRRVAYVVGDDRSEVWALEGFLPLAP